MYDTNTPKATAFQILALVLLFTATAPGQVRNDDLIIKRDSVKIKCKIEIVNDQVIRYKKSSDPLGPLFYISKSDVAKVIYGNGESETFLNVKELVFKDNKENIVIFPVTPWTQRGFTDDLTIWKANELKSAFKFYKAKEKSSKTMGIFFGLFATAATITGVVLVRDAKQKSSYGYYYSDYDKKQIGIAVIVCGLSSGITIGTLGGLKSKKNRRMASLVQQELVRRKEPLSVFLNPGYNNKTGSLSLTLNF